MLGLILLRFCGWNVVTGDQISMCWIFDRFYRGELTFHDLWEDYHGHRIFVQRAVEVAAGALTHWNVNYEIILTYVAAIGIFLLLMHLLRKSRGVLPTSWRFPLAMLFSAFVFSTNQHGSWSNGFALGTTLSVFWILVGVTTLAAPQVTATRLSVGMVAGVLASYSYGNGFLYWVACVPMLAARLRTDRFGTVKIGAWLLATVGVVFFYFYGLSGTGTGIPLGTALRNGFQRPLHFAAYGLTYLGSPALHLNGSNASYLPTATRSALKFGPPLFGLMGLGGLLWLSARLTRENRTMVVTLTPWWTLASYALMSAAVTTVARASTSVVAGGLSSQYVVFSQFLWLPLFVMAAVVAGEPKAKAGVRRWGPLPIGLLGVLVLAYVVSYGNGLRKFVVSSAQARQIRADLLGQPTAKTIALINADEDPAQVARSVEILRQHRLATFGPAR